MRPPATARGRERGQVLPLWIASVLATLVLIFGALNYGNTLRWNIRAQNAADSAANALIMIQTERWNEMNEALYASNVEEYRIRRLLNGILLAANNSGQCANYPVTYQSCYAVYAYLVPEYLEAVQRYTADVTLLQAITNNATYANWLQDANALLAHIQSSANCNDPKVNTTAVSMNTSGGDCAFALTMNGTPLQRRLLGTVQYNAYTLLIPGLGKSSPHGTDTENAQLWAPLQVDVVACAKVPPLIPNFWKYHVAPFYAVGRAGETAIMSVEEWFQPGALFEQYQTPQQHFQDAEQYVAGYPSSIYDWYAVDFGGNAATANATAGGFAGKIAVDELSVRLGWWNSIPVAPFNAAPVQAAVCPA